MSEKIELSEAIGELRAQLNRAIKEGKEEDLRFEVVDLELELQVVATRATKVSGNAEAGVKFWLLGAGKVSGGGEMRDETAQLQKIKLKLRPTVPGPKEGERQSALVADQDDEPLIPG